MIKCRDVMDIMERIAPKKLAEDWDNPGLLVGSPKGEVRRILVCLDVRIDRRVDGHGGRETAGADTAGDLKGEHPVRRRVAQGDAQGLLQCIHDRDAAAHIARRAEADTDGVPAAGLGGEERIKAGDT